MVQIKTDNTIISMRGRFGGVYFKKGQSQHIQAMPRIVNYPRVGAQGAFRDGFSELAALWMLALLGFWAASWAAYALIHLIGTTRRPEPKRVSGYNWFIHYGMMFPEEQRPPFWKPPHSPHDLPDYVITAGNRRFYYQTPDQFPPETPCNYFWDFMPINGKPSYKDDDNLWYLWWHDPDWAVSQAAGAITPLSTFFSQTPEIVGWYRNPWSGKRCHVYVGKRELVAP